MNFKNLIYPFAISMLLASCSSSSNDDLTADPDPDPDPTALTYDVNIKTIIDNNCINCHGSPTANGAPTSYTTYTQVKNAIDNIISRTNNASSPMPQGGLMSQSLRDQIQQWKDDGLLEN